VTLGLKENRKKIRRTRVDTSECTDVSEIGLFPRDSGRNERVKFYAKGQQRPERTFLEIYGGKTLTTRLFLACLKKRKEYEEKHRKAPDEKGKRGREKRGFSQKYLSNVQRSLARFKFSALAPTSRISTGRNS